MNQEDKNKTLVRSLIDDAFNQRNLSLLQELLHPDFVNHNDLLPTQNKKGPQVFEELYTKMFESFPDIKIENHLLIAKDDLVIMPAIPFVVRTTSGQLILGRTYFGAAAAPQSTLL
ncbi:MAG: ester cyclase, partial [Thermodesulfobacteriota bacterium]